MLLICCHKRELTKVRKICICRRNFSLQIKYLLHFIVCFANNLYHRENWQLQPPPLVVDEVRTVVVAAAIVEKKLKNAFVDTENIKVIDYTQKVAS